MNPPIVIQPTAPVLADKAVQELQNAIKNVFFFESDGTTPRNWFADGFIFPLVRRDETTGTPILYWKGQDYFEFPADQSFGSYAFFYEDDPRSATGGGFTDFNFNLVVWFNEDYFQHNLPFRIREYFINDILQALNAVLEEDDQNSITVFTQPSNVFANFNIDTSVNPMFKAPFDGFRISFGYAAQTDCGQRMIMPVTT